MPFIFADTLRSIDRLVEEAATRSSHAALTEDREHGRAECVRAVNACNNARQLIVYVEEMVRDMTKIADAARQENEGEKKEC